MKVLVIGGGGKEHALIWKLSRSKHITKIFCSPGNAGIAGIAECIDVHPQHVDALVDFVKYEWIDLTIVCSGIFLAPRIVDAFDRRGCKLFGLNRKAVSLGTSRVCLRDFMRRHRIPTAEYRVFSSYLPARDYVQLKGLPLVIKTDGSPGEKGIFYTSTFDDASEDLKRILREQMFGDSGSRIIIEEDARGERISFVTIADEKGIRPLASIHKYGGISELGGHSDPAVFCSCATVPDMTKKIEQQVMEDVMHPVHKALSAEGAFFRGFISADLIIQEKNISVFELQFGFGDLEPQTIMPGLKGDIGELILFASNGELSAAPSMSNGNISVCIALFSRKDPGGRGNVSKITGLDLLRNAEHVFVFHENTVFEDGDIVTPGGTALYVTAIGTTLEEASRRALSAAEKIHFPGMEYKGISEIMRAE